MIKLEKLKKTYVFYGGLMGLLMFALQMVQYKTTIRDIRLEVFGVIVGIIFMGLGIWVGILLFGKKTSQKRFDPHKLGLSKREMEVLELLSEGLSNQEIADRLFVSLNTAKTHISNIYQKLDVKRRTQAIQKATEMALIPTKNE